MPAENHVMFTGLMWICGDEDNIVPKGGKRFVVNVPSCQCTRFLY